VKRNLEDPIMQQKLEKSKYIYFFLPVKFLVFWKVLHNRLPPHKECRKRGLWYAICIPGAKSKRKIFIIFYLIVILLVIFGLGFKISTTILLTFLIYV